MPEESAHPVSEKVAGKHARNWISSLYHLNGIEERMESLVFKAWGPAIPKLALVEGRVQHRWCIPGACQFLNSL